MVRHYVGDPQKFQRITTSVRLRIDQFDRIKKDRFNLSIFIEDCLDYYFGIRTPAGDKKKIDKIAEAVSKAKPVMISKEIPAKFTKKEKIYCPRADQNVYEDFFKSELCEGEECRFYKTGECPFVKKEQTVS